MKATGGDDGDGGRKHGHSVALYTILWRTVTLACAPFLFIRGYRREECGLLRIRHGIAALRADESGIDSGLVAPTPCVPPT